MRLNRRAAIVLALWPALAVLPAFADGAPRVALETDLGTIVVELDPVHAPVTVANFLRYVDEGRYTAGGRFYRVVRDDNQPDSPVKIDVIQGGLDFEEPSPLELPPIEHETTEATGLRHLDGTVSMARLGPGTASSEIFVCVGAQPELDFGGRRNPDGQGFAAFGRVVEGMDVVRAIHRLAQEGQRLLEPVRFTARRAFPPSDARELARRLLDVWESGDEEVLRELFADDVVYDDLPNQRRLVGFEESAGYVRHVHAWASGVGMETISVRGDAETAWAEWRFRAIQDRPIPGRVPVATGRPVDLRGVTLVEARDGRIVRAADYLDALGFVLQLGARVELPGGVVVGEDRAP